MIRLIECVNIYTVVETLFPVGFSYDVASSLLDIQEATEKQYKSYNSSLKKFQNDLKGVVNGSYVAFPSNDQAKLYEEKVRELEYSTVKVDFKKINKKVFEEELKASEARVTPGQLKYLKLILEP